MVRTSRSRALFQWFCLGCCMAVLIALVVPTASAGEIDTSFPFVLDEWIEINYEEDGLKIQRIRVETIESNFKSRVFRPGLKNDPLIQDVQIQVEYSNDTTRDVEADLEIFWVDAKGERIDGYAGEEDMDEGERNEEMTALRSTLVYGLDAAKKLEVKIKF